MNSNEGTEQSIGPKKDVGSCLLDRYPYHTHHYLETDEPSSGV